MLPPPLAPNGRPLAAFLDRFLAYLLDGLILGAIGMVAVMPLMLIYFFLVFNEINSAQQTGGTPDPALFVIGYFVMIAAIILITMVAAYFYFVEYQLRRGGQTVGKKVMKIWVIPVAPGEALTRMHLVKRWLVQSVAAQFIIGLGLLDGLWLLWDKPLQQCLLDKAAQTVVVKLG